MKNVRIRVKDGGYDIYSPREGQTWGYRYGPSIMTYGDKRADAWFASPGDALTEADWFTYRHTEDGGKTWTEEKVVLAPTADSMDFFSVCDPAMIRFGGWYYMGYTSTIFPERGGICNNGFVARSKTPTGPFEKWTGDGWGEVRETGNGTCRWVGKPAPIIYFDEDKEHWGAGEFSFTVVDDVLYIYYTWTSKDALGKLYSQTRVATADATDENWPLTMVDRGVAAERLSAQDSFDVVYCEEYKKFIAISTYKRFSEESVLMFFESDDGINFYRACDLKENIGVCCHNSGISGDELHHIKKGDLLILGYAYGNKWGYWGTRFHEYTFEEYDGVYSEEDKENVKRPVIPTPRENMHSIYITSIPHFYRLKEGEFTDINIVSLDSTYTKTHVDNGDIEFSNYDSDIISIENGRIFALKVGYTFVNASAEGCNTEFAVYVYPKEARIGCEEREPVSFDPTLDTYTLSIAAREKKQVRFIVTYDNGTWGEMFGTDANISYSGYDTELISVDERGCITNKGKTGKTKINAALGEFCLTVDVEITE